jgi:hypothetical protein
MADGGRIINLGTTILGVIFQVRQQILLQFYYSDGYRGFGQVCGPNQKELK